MLKYSQNSFILKSISKPLLGFTIFIGAYAYIYSPVDRCTPSPSEVYILSGKPKFANGGTAQSSDIYFFINDIRLNCAIGEIDGRNGCEIFMSAIDIKKSVQATYFWMPTRLWYSYKMIYSLEQEGKNIISPNMAKDSCLKSNKSGWSSYIFFLPIFFILGVFVIYVEILGIKAASKLKDK